MSRVSPTEALWYRGRVGIVGLWGFEGIYDEFGVAIAEDTFTTEDILSLGKNLYEVLRAIGRRPLVGSHKRSVHVVFFQLDLDIEEFLAILLLVMIRFGSSRHPLYASDRCHYAVFLLPSNLLLIYLSMIQDDNCITRLQLIRHIYHYAEPFSQGL